MVAAVVDVTPADGVTFSHGVDGGADFLEMLLVSDGEMVGEKSLLR